jgi:hypothetical protein
MLQTIWEITAVLDYVRILHINYQRAKINTWKPLSLVADIEEKTHILQHAGECYIIKIIHP